MIQQLLDRRVPQFVGLYLVGCWGFLEFFDWFVSRYVLSPALVDFALAVLLLFLPTVAIIAWRHGAPGPDTWKRTDGAVIGLNALVAAGALLVMFRGENLGAATTVKLVEDTEGNTVERVVPKAEFRRSVMLFDLENESGDADRDWLEYGLNLALAMDLAQDVFVTATSTEEAGIREYLREHGAEPGADIPLSLKRDAARLRGSEYFYAGEFAERGDSLRIVTNLYQTSSGRSVATHEYVATDPREVADRMSLDLRRDLGIPEGQLGETVDLPAEELLTESPEAFRLISEGHEQLMRYNDPVAARARAAEALALDSTAAMAHLLEANGALFLGDQAASGAAVDRAIRYDYRLPERYAIALQVQKAYLFEGDREAALRAGRYWTEVYPNDVEARRLLAAIHASAGEVEEQITQLRALLAIDSTDAVAMRQLAASFAQQAEYDSAIAYQRRLIGRRPGELDVRLEMAATLRSAARFDEARQALADAEVVDSQDPDVPREMAVLDLRVGDIAAAERHLEDVKNRERTPNERARRIGLEESIYYQRGQFDRLEDAYRRRLAALEDVLPPFGVVQQIDNSEFLMYAGEAERGATALAEIERLSATVQPPWNLQLSPPAVRIHLDRDDVDGAREAVASITEFAESFGMSDNRRAYVAWAEGRIAEIEDGNCARASTLYDQARELNPTGALFAVARLACLAESERWEEGDSDVEWLLERYPGFPKYRLAIAEYLAERGRSEEAVRHVDAALDAWSEADATYLPAQRARTLRAELGG